MTSPSMGPMQGVKILDLGSMIAGPAAASILADQGADVIRPSAHEAVQIGQIFSQCLFWSLSSIYNKFRIYIP